MSYIDSGLPSSTPASSITGLTATRFVYGAADGTVSGNAQNTYDDATGNATFGSTNGSVNINSKTGLSFTKSIESNSANVGFSITGATDTGRPLSTEVIGLRINLAQTKTWATGAIATQREVTFEAPTYAFAGASTITTAATVAISGPPIAGANCTITTPVAVLIASGNQRFTGASAQIQSASGLTVIADSGASMAVSGASGTLAFGATGVVQVASGSALMQASNTVTISKTVASSSGAITPFVFTGTADTGRTLSTEVIELNFNFSQTKTWATGALATQRNVVFQAPTYAFAGASTITNAVTLEVTGAPTAGANCTITNAYAFRVAAGRARFVGGWSLPAAKTQSTVGAAGGASPIPGDPLGYFIFDVDGTEVVSPYYNKA